MSNEGRGRWALGAFVAYLVAAFYLLVFRLGRWIWFIGDEWGLVTDRSLSDLDGLFEPQNSHWSTLPAVAYQLLFETVGLNTYRPYLACTVVLHLTLAVLLRLIMRRAGVGPWIATVVAGSFVLFGAGDENILQGFQMTLVGSMVFGIIHLLLADHDGPWGRKDTIGVGAGVLGLMCSGAGIPMVAIVGLAVLVRRGWRLAICHTAPLAGLYGLWFAWQSSNVTTASPGRTPVSTLLEWVVEAEVAAFRAVAGSTIVALGLAVLLVVGLALAWGRLERDELRRRSAAPAALLVGGVVMMVVVASQRAVAGDLAATSRYVHVVTALTLPALGVAADAVSRRWRVAGPVVLLLFLVGVPANIGRFPGTYEPRGRLWYQSQREFVLGAAHSPVAEQVPRSVYPDPNEYRADLVTVGFLLDALDAGQLPDPPRLSVEEQQRIDTRLIVSQSRMSDVVPRASCTTHDDPLILHPERGQQFVLEGDVRIARGLGGGAFTAPVHYSPAAAGRVLTVQLPGQTLRVRAPGKGNPIRWCSVP